MKKLYPFLFTGIFFCLIIQTSSAQLTEHKIKTIDSALILLHNRGMFNGVVLLAEKGNPLFKKAYGVASIETNEPLTTQSSFNLASISKQFVAMMVMILQEKGKLHYDAKVQQYLPSFPYPSITIRNLLTHTSGLPEYFDLAFRYNNTLDTLNNEKLVQLLAKYQPPLNFETGTRWEYCNTGYVLLASIIEKASGQPVADFFSAQIAEPLSLQNTFLYYLNMPGKTRQPQRVLGFERKDGKNYPNDLVRFDGVFGDGNVYSSADDLLKWEQSLYTSALVSPSTMKEAFTPVQLKDGSSYPYGFGWFIKNGGNLLTHTGSWVGFFNLIERDLSNNSTAIVLSNSTNATARKIVDEIISGKPFAVPSTQLIRNVQVIDGTGTRARKGDVRLADDKIWEQGNLIPFANEPVTDGEGLVLAPGFIDSHSHHFGSLYKHPEALATVNQGITTIVIGQDGGSYPMDTLQAFFSTGKAAVNVASYTGQASLREEVMGTKNLYRIAKELELDSMKAILKKELQKGSLGLSTGLEYEESFFSNKDEVLQLAKVVAEENGRYISHIRSEDINLDEAVDEIIEIGRNAKIPVQISHIKISKKDQWGKSPQLLAKLQAARAQGINITADCYTYDFWNSTLRVLFPNRDYTNPASAAFAVDQLFDADKSILVHFAPNKTYEGKSIGAIAILRKEQPPATLMNLIAIAADFEEKHPDYDDGVEAIMGKSMDETDVRNFLRWPQTNICSDGANGGHPRGYGTFTKFLGKYVREQKLVPLETAIYKMTGLTAEHLGITDRGTIRNGNYADLVLFNPATVTDHSDITNSKALSTGIEKVWLNGELIYNHQKPTGKFPGRLIKKS